MSEMTETQIDREIPETAVYGWLCDYRSGDRLRHATREEAGASEAQAAYDGGRGVVAVGGRDVYVEGPAVAS